MYISVTGVQTCALPIYYVGYGGELPYYDEALLAGFHIGALSAQDNHSRDWGTKNDVRTVVLAKELTKEAIMDGYRHQRFYATEDKTLEMEFSCLGRPMGSRLAAGSKELTVSLGDNDGEIFKDIVLIKNGKTYRTKDIDTSQGSWTFSVGADRDDAYYYVYIVQQDGDNAMSSPIWVAGGLPSDSIAPSTTMESPVDGSTVMGPGILVSGTCFDNSGGTGVATVEVSTDGGSTWENAEGTTHWVYPWEPFRSGPTTIQARGRDFNNNLESPAASVSVNVTAYKPGSLISLAGYMMTSLNASEGGTLALLALSSQPSITEVALLYQGVQIATLPQGTDGGFHYQLTIPATGTPFRALLELATKSPNGLGLSWPYLSVLR